MAKRTYTREELTVLWDSDKCGHGGDCLNGLPAVFDLNARPWVNMNGASVEEIRKQVLACPSGALSLGEPPGVTACQSKK